jgi:prevent-host-death family protein
MTTTLREAKAKLSEMVKRASRGEEVVITVHGKGNGETHWSFPAKEQNRQGKMAETP